MFLDAIDALLDLVVSELGERGPYAYTVPMCCCCSCCCVEPRDRVR